MPSINLLPWREEAKQQRLNEFYGFMAGAALFSCLLIYLVISVIGSQIEQQQSLLRQSKEKAKNSQLKL